VSATPAQLDSIRRFHIAFAKGQSFPGDYKWYVPEGTDHDNRVLTGLLRPTALGNRITRQDIIDSSVQADPVVNAKVMVPTPPFETEMDDEMLKTNSVADMQAFWDDVWLKVGCRALDANDVIIAGVEKASQMQYNEQQRMLSTNGGKPTTYSEFGYPTPTTVQYPTTVPG
jgi:hypothetical protein